MDGVKHRDGIKVIYHLLLKKKTLPRNVFKNMSQIVTVHAVDSIDIVHALFQC